MQKIMAYWYLLQKIFSTHYPHAHLEYKLSYDHFLLDSFKLLVNHQNNYHQNGISGHIWSDSDSWLNNLHIPARLATLKEGLEAYVIAVIPHF